MSFRLRCPFDHREVCDELVPKLGPTVSTHTGAADRHPAFSTPYLVEHLVKDARPGGQDGLDGAHRLPGVTDEEGDVAELRHRGEELHVLGETGLVLEGAEVRLSLRHRAETWQQQAFRHLQ